MRRMYDKEEIKEIAAESGGSKIDSLDLVVGQPTVTYDTTDGITIESTGKLNGTDDIVVSNEIPIVAGEGISIDKAADKEQIVIKSTGGSGSSGKVVTITDAQYESLLTFTDSVAFQNKDIIPSEEDILAGKGKVTLVKQSSAIDSVINTLELYFYVQLGVESGIHIFQAQGLINNVPVFYVWQKLSNGMEVCVNLDKYSAEISWPIRLSNSSIELYSSGQTNNRVLLNSNTSEAYLVAIEYDTSANKLSNTQLYGSKIRYVPSMAEGTLYTLNLPAANGTLVVGSQLPTLFGNKSLTAGGNIDLYRHNINFGDKLYFTPISSNELEIDSLTDLQTVFPADAWMSCSGTSPDGQSQVIAINCSTMQYKKSDDTIASLAEYSAPTDTVTTV